MQPVAFVPTIWASSESSARSSELLADDEDVHIFAHMCLTAKVECQGRSGQTTAFMSKSFHPCLIILSFPKAIAILSGQTCDGSESCLKSARGLVCAIPENMYRYYFASELAADVQLLLQVWA